MIQKYSSLKVNIILDFYEKLILIQDIYIFSGDPQYDVYRQMKSASQSNWEEFHPKTNVLWVAFLAGWFSRNLKGKTKTAKTLANASRSLKIKSKMEDVVERLEQLFPN